MNRLHALLVGVVINAAGLMLAGPPMWGSFASSAYSSLRWAR